MSEDMMRERERQKWEEEVLEELDEETGPIHYQDVQHNGVFTVLLCLCWNSRGYISHVYLTTGIHLNVHW